MAKKIQPAELDALVSAKLNRIKEFNLLSLVLSDRKPFMKKGLIVFEIQMCSRCNNMDIYRLQSLIKFNIISRVEVNGLNKFWVHFTPSA